MKCIFISIPISGKEDSYDERLEEAVKYVKEKYPEYEIITPKDAAKNLEQSYFPLQPKYKDYLISDIQEIYDCDAIFMCNEWYNSKGCQAERAFAEAIGLEIFNQPEYSIENICVSTEIDENLSEDKDRVRNFIRRFKAKYANRFG